MKEELKVIISAEIDKLKSAINSAKQQVNSFSAEVKKQSANVNDSFAKIGDGINAGMKTAAAATGAVVAAIAGITTASVKAYADYEQLTGGVEKLFGSSANIVMNYANEAYKNAGVSANDYMTQITSFSASLISSLGGDTAAAAEIGNMAVNDMADNANVFGSNIADIQNAYQGFAKGNFSMLDNLKLGFGGSATEMARLVNESGVLGDAYIDLADKQNIGAALQEVGFAKIVEAIHKTQEKMKITGTTMKEAEGTISGSIAMVKASWENLMIGLAQDEANIPALVGNVVSSAASVLENIIPVVKQILANIPAAISEISPEAGAAAQVIIDTLGAAFDLLLPIIENVGTIILKVMGYLSQHQGVVIAMATAIGVVSAAITAYNAVQAIKNALDITGAVSVGTLTTAVAAHAVAMAAALAPYLAIAAAIAAVIAIIVVCVKHWDEIKAKVKEVAENIKQKVGEMKDKVVGFFSDMGQKIATKVGEIKQKCSDTFSNIKQTISDASNAAKDKAVESLSKMKQAYQDNGGGIKGIAAATMEGVKGYFSSGYAYLDTLTNGKLSNIVNTISNKLTAAKNNVSEKLGAIRDKFQSIMDTCREKVGNAIEKIKNFFKFEWSLPKLKLPHINISGKFSLNPPSIPKFSVDWYAKGGVFDNIQLFGYGGGIGGLGENGAEAIVPLEKNTEWLDRIAERLAAKQGSTPIILNVDGKTFAQTSINTINQLTRQTGALGLNIV